MEAEYFRCGALMGVVDFVLLACTWDVSSLRRNASSRGEMVALKARFTIAYDGTTFDRERLVQGGTDIVKLW